MAITDAAEYITANVGVSLTPATAATETLMANVGVSTTQPKNTSEYIIADIEAKRHIGWGIPS